jgi:hypothetical protein
VNESGLYHLIFTSRKDSAIEFRKWVTRDVLPALRRTGTYTAPNALNPYAQGAELMVYVEEMRSELVRVNARLDMLNGKVDGSWDRLVYLSSDIHKLTHFVSLAKGYLYKLLGKEHYGE